jgi:hypothetical protein
MNLFLVLVIGVLVILASAGFFFPEEISTAWLAAGNLLTIAEIMGLILLLVNGVFMGTTLYRITMGFCVLSLVSLALKILHMPGADETLMLSFFTIPVLYLIHFLLKKQKDLLDFLKVFAVFAFFLPAPLILLHLVPRDVVPYISVASHGTFAIALIYFIVDGITKKTLFRS